MRKILVVTAFLAAFVPSSLLAQTASHPRLLFTSDDVGALRAKVHDGVGNDDAAFQTLMGWVTQMKVYPGSLFGSVGSAFNAVPAFGTAYQLADPGDPDRGLYAQRCREALLALTPQNPYNFIDIYNESMRLYALTIGFDLCFESAPPADRQAIVDEIVSWLDAATYWDWHHYLNRPYTFNKGLMGAAALGLGSIVLRDETAPTALLDDALSLSDAILSINFQSQMQPDGAYGEGVLYAAWSMRFLSPYFEARRRFDGVDYGLQPNVSKMVEWLAYGIKPDAQAHVETLNDTLQNTYPLALHNTFLEWAQSRYGSGLAAWLWGKEVPQVPYGVSSDLLATILWNNGLAAINPGSVLPPARVFPNRGLYYYRTGWPGPAEATSSDTVFTVYSGKFWGGHAQEDQGQFTLYAKGNDFVVDTGYSPNGKDTRGHNLVLIDPHTMANGGDQHNAGGTVGTDGKLQGWLITPFADFVHADNEAAYDTYSEFNAPNYPYPGADWSWGYDGGNPVERADRFALAVKRSLVGEYFVIFDDIQKDDALSHRYDWLLHTRLENCFNLGAGQAAIVRGLGGCATPCTNCGQLNVTFVHPDPGDLSLSSALFDVTGNGNDGDTQRLVATTNTVNPNFFVVLYPQGDGEAAPVVTRPTVTGGFAATLTWSSPNVVDQVVFAENGGQAFLTGLTLNGRVGVVRKINTAIAAYSLSEGSGLYVGSVSAAIVHGGHVASLASDGQKITLSDRSYPYTLFGPGVTQVVDAAGAAVAFQKSGNYVYVNKNPPGGGRGEFEN